MDGSRDYVDGAAGRWSSIHPGEDLEPFAILLRVIRAGRIVESLFDDVTRAHDFEVRGDYEVLATLRRAHPAALRPQDLADHVMISAPGVTGRLDRLEGAGLVTRAPHPGDRRAILVEITPAGIEAVDRTFLSVAAEARKSIDALTRRHQRRLGDELRGLLLALGDAPRPD